MIREGPGNSSGPRLEATRGIRLIKGHYTRGRLEGRGSVKMVDGTQFECDFVNGRVEGWVVSTFTRSLGDLDTDTKTLLLDIARGAKIVSAITR